MKGAFNYFTRFGGDTEMEVLNIANDVDLSYPDKLERIIAVCDGETHLTFARGLDAPEFNGADVAALISDMLMVNTSLLGLDFVNFILGLTGISSICNALKENTTLCHLKLRGEDTIGVDVATQLSDMLKGTRTLKTLALVGSSTNALFVEILMDGVKHNASLRTLALKGSAVGDDSASSIGCMLKYNTTLRALSLQGASIGTDGTESIAEGLRENTSLSTLELAMSPADSGRSAAMADALEHNMTLTTLRGAITSIEGKDFKRILDYLDRNEKLAASGHRVKAAR